ncbi:Uncharacterized protein FKW44_012145, partial [Caligus rogercresseyi]
LHPSRPPSGMSTDSRNSAASTGGGGVRMRSTPSRRPRPISIATTGVMSSSLHLENKKPPMNPSPLAARNRQKCEALNIPMCGVNKEILRENKRVDDVIKMKTPMNGAHNYSSGV